MNERQRYSETVNERHLRLQQELLNSNLVVLSKIREQNPHLVFPFKQKLWDHNCIRENSIDNPLEMIVKAQCTKILFFRIVEKFLNIINIPKSLSLIIFPKLVELNLKDNFISTIQPIYQLRAPLLQYLYLSENLITNIRSLRKCCFPCLWLLDLRMNPIPSFDCLPEMNTEKLAYLRLLSDSDNNLYQWWLSKTEISFEPLPSVLLHPNPDLNFLIKSQSKFLFLCECQAVPNSRKRSLLRQRSLRS